MDKRQLVDAIQTYLAEELAELVAAAGSAEQLAGSGAQRAAEIQSQLMMYRFLPLRELGEQDVICPAALVELEHGSTRAFYFITPQGGGLITQVEGRPVQVVTPNSPIGEALLGHRQGDEIEVRSRGGARRYRILSVR